MNVTKHSPDESNLKEGAMTAAEVISAGLRDNPEVLLVLEIANRARAVEQTNPAIDLTPKNDVVTIPTDVQCILPR